jgi:acetylornithine deacetylase/succinyl-diaminopimelate desuccinylase-like protein
VISLDRRTLPGETNRGVLEGIQTLLRRRKLAARVIPPRAEPSLPLETDAQNPLVRRLMAAAGQREPAGAVFFSDASILAHGGTPSVLFGPGDIAQAHTAHEYISLRSLQQARRTLRRFLESLP